MTSEEIKSLFSSFQNKKILIIGDVMIDAYVWGKVTRISPEAPVPILNSTTKENRLGGAANVALNIKSMGAQAILAAVIGDDPKAESFIKLLKKKDLPSHGILKGEGRITTTKTRIISHNQQLIRLDREIDSPLSNMQEDLLTSNTLKIISEEKIDAIIFEDYDKGVITEKLIQKIVSTANKKNIPTLVDPKKRNFLSYRNVTFFKPNFKELKEGTNLNVLKSDFNGIFEASIQLNKILNAKYLITTLSDLGVFISKKDSYEVIPAEVRQIADVSGAGDTVISVSSLCLANNLKIEQVARIANLAGGLVCEKVGVVPIDVKLLEKETHNFFNSKQKR